MPGHNKNSGHVAVASLRGERDIAVRNMVGVTFFCILAVVGLTGLVSPQGIPVSVDAMRFDIRVMSMIAMAGPAIFQRLFLALGRHVVSGLLARVFVASDICRGVARCCAGAGWFHHYHHAAVDALGVTDLLSTFPGCPGLNYF